jgi:uncharacterized damage-inducible protein DinB
VTVLREGLRHHSWATDELLERCGSLSEEELTRHIPAIYGSTLETARHLVDADDWYLSCISEGEIGDGDLDADDMSLSDVRAVASRNAAGWEEILQRDLDPDRSIAVTRKDGSVTHATVGIRLAQVLHHGSDHRSQICTALTILGHQPPEFDVWAYGETVGLTREDEPSRA